MEIASYRDEKRTKFSREHGFEQISPNVLSPPPLTLRLKFVRRSPRSLKTLSWTTVHPREHSRTTPSSNIHARNHPPCVHTRAFPISSPFEKQTVHSCTLHDRSLHRFFHSLGLKYIRSRIYVYVSCFYERNKKKKKKFVRSWIIYFTAVERGRSLEGLKVRGFFRKKVEGWNERGRSRGEERGQKRHRASIERGGAHLIIVLARYALVELPC